MKAFRIGLYGCGCRTRQVLERALKSGMAKVTLCHDIDCGKAGELAEKYHAEPCTLNKLLSGEEVDMYLISLFPAAHPQRQKQGNPFTLKNRWRYSCRMLSG